MSHPADNNEKNHTFLLSFSTDDREVIFMKKNSNLSTANLCLSGVMAALYFVLDYFATGINLALFGNNIKISLNGLPIIITAIIAGPYFAAATGFVGAFLNQMIHYGFTATTLLWVLPAAVRGLTVGFLFIAFKRSLKPHLIIIETVISSLAVTVLNTIAMYTDSKINHYYSFAYVFGGIGPRVLLGVLTAAVLAIVTVPVVRCITKIPGFKISGLS